jgi:AbrB family looped-hinge helix DNA binding protein
MDDKKLYGTATVGTKGQVVIPSAAREVLGIAPGDTLYVVGSCSKNFVGFIKEEQLAAMIEHVTENIENYKNALQQNKE